MFAYCSNTPVTGYDPTGAINATGVAVGLAIFGLGLFAAVVTVLSAGTASPLVATGISAIGAAVSTSLTETGVVVTGGALTESVIVADVSVVNGTTHNKQGFSVVVDFAESSTETYYHCGKTTAGFSATYGIGFVNDYSKAGDYGGAFFDVSGTVSSNGIDYGIDYCTSPKEPFTGSSAVLFTVGVSFPPSNPSKKSVSIGMDYYVPISYYMW